MSTYTTKTTTTKTLRFSRLEALHKADLVLFMDFSGKVTCAKNREGKLLNRELTTDEVIDTAITMICKHAFSNGMKIFQASSKIEIIKAINRILRGEYENTV